VPAEYGLTFPVMVRDIQRINCIKGLWNCDIDAFALVDPTEHFWSGRTRTLERGHRTMGYRLWGNGSWMRQMFTFIADIVPSAALHCNDATLDLVPSTVCRRAKARTPTRRGIIVGAPKLSKKADTCTSRLEGPLW
jgi:uncharacterized protein YcgI (DUF1989 family)